ncbi:MAG: hypothetical protein M3Y27_26130 [Acidobacteriota bacterium]|nr:hypothetical protein [Acidobacteriota bacterium]
MIAMEPQDSVTPAKLPRIAYRQFHDQSNTAAVARVVLAEFGIAHLDISKRGQELQLHGLIQRGAYEEGRGWLLRNALQQLSDAGLPATILHDTARTAALQGQLSAADSELRLRFHEDLGMQGGRALSIEKDCTNDARVLLVDAQHATRGLPVHILLVRPEGESFYVMNTATGQDHKYDAAQLAAHLASPVKAGAIGFAGRQYLYTGIAVRISK